MSELVFIEPARKNPEPFTTSEVIAGNAGIQHHTVTRLLKNHREDFEAFGKVGFEIEAIEGSKTGQSKTLYILNEQQATLLITYLKNTESVRDFKKDLVRQFYAMRTELMSRQMQRAERKPIRRAMTDVIVEVDESKWAFKKYTDLAYKSAIGKNAAQIRKERGAEKKSTASNFMTSEEVAAVAKSENQVAVLLELGMSYEQVKEILLNRRVVGTLGAHAIITSAG